MRHTARASPDRARRAEHPLPRPRYFVWFTPTLGLLLGGYLFFSKSFAYLHVPGTPVFVGEIVLGIGIFEVLGIPSPWRHLLTRAPVLKGVLAFLAVCCIRLFFDYPRYGVDAIRDASIGYYGLFALLTAAATVCEPTFVPRLLSWYRRVLPAFLVWAPVAIALSDVDALSGIVVPGTTTGINSFKAGDFGVQVAMAVTFLWLDGPWPRGERTRTPSRTIALSIVGVMGLFVCLTQNRGGFLAGAATLLVVALYLPSGRRMRLTLPLVGALATIALLVSLLNLRLPISEREISLQQVTANFLSIIQHNNSEQLSGTVEWREQLWQRLRDDMLSSGAWRTGLGFGPVLGELYGVSDPNDPRPLRNAHNSHLTIFARMGAVGLAIWALLWLAWCHRLHRWIRRRPGGVRDPDGAIAAWVLAGSLGLLINAYFDPSLEGPQACIWLYVLFGIGAAKTRRQRASSGSGLGGRDVLRITEPGSVHSRMVAERVNRPLPVPAEQNAPVTGANRWNVARVTQRARRLQGIARRLGWAVADQAISSLTNFLVGFFVARSLGPTEFGAFSIAFATYLIALNASRGLATDALLVRYSGVRLSEWRRGVAGSTATAISVGIIGGIACIALGILMSGPTGLAFLALGMTMPGLLLQDSWRFAFFSAGRAGRAFANDCARALVLLVLIGLVIASGRSSEFYFMLAWGASATIAALLGAVQARLLPQVHLAAEWLRKHRDLCSRYLAENLSVTAGTQLKFYGLAAVGGLAVVGALRASELLFGGVYVITQGIGLMAVPEAVRLLRQSTLRLRQFSMLLSALAGGGAIVCGVALLAIPESLGQRLLHSSWAPASGLILPMTVFMAAFGMQMGAWAGVRALAAASRSLLSQGVGSALSLAGALLGAAAAGAIGAAWGIAAGAVLSTAFWWWQFRLGLCDFRRAEDRPTEPGRTSNL
jgi:O-antigen/teichoic acid export membrane protein